MLAPRVTLALAPAVRACALALPEDRMASSARFWRVPLDAARINETRGEVTIVVERCKGCGFCVEYCPRKILVLSHSFNRKGYHPPAVGKPGACLNCTLCEMLCPEFAIFSHAAPDHRPKGEA